MGFKWIDHQKYQKSSADIESGAEAMRGVYCPQVLIWEAEELD